ncbi:MAG TPA: hypothetical protein VGH53_03710 [Streptosporangiaceae bacterium]
MHRVLLRSVGQTFIMPNAASPAHVGSPAPAGPGFEILPGPDVRDCLAGRASPGQEVASR